MEDAVAAETALGHGLGIVLEGIRRGLGAGINDGQHEVVLLEREFDTRTLAANGTGHHVAGHAQPLRVAAVVHLAQLLDGYVVALTLLHAGEGKISERHQDDQDGDGESEVSGPIFMIEHAAPLSKL